MEKGLYTLLFVMVLWGCYSGKAQDKVIDAAADVLRPYKANPAYWQYKGDPVLLLGCTDDDNLFQMEGLEAHLDALAEAGGNYIRNTMSYRDTGNVLPYKRLSDGRYDLEEWGEEFWLRFENMLEWTAARDIIVQIEVWDRFDYSRDRWDINPFHPDNNVNYEMKDGIFERYYPHHPGADKHPFFHSIPGLPMYSPALDRIRAYQEGYIDKMLSYTLKYGHVLYCMNNETTTPVTWGDYWIDYIRDKAEKKGVEVYLTDMYDHFFRVSSCESCQALIAKPEYYTFMDISQINSRNFGQVHWDTLQRIMDLRNLYPIRPVNNTKIYGGGNFGFGTGTNQDGVERFCRNVIGGCASARHHRPPHGNGLNEKAKASLRATRKVEEWVKFWDIRPRMDLLGNRKDNECYLAAEEGVSYVLYFPAGGEVELDLRGESGPYTLHWVSVSTGEKGKEEKVTGGKKVAIHAENEEGWYGVLVLE